MNTETPPRVTTRAVIFDLDGVLVWTIPMHWWAFRKTFEGEGTEFTFEDYMGFALGASRDEVIRHVLGELPKEKLDELMKRKGEYVCQYLEEKGVEAIPGSQEFVREVRERQLKTAVASASRTPRLLLESIGTDALFDVIIDRSMVERSKPHPDVFLLCAEELGVEPSHCIVIEDSDVGIDAARAADMRVIALTTTHDRRQLQRADAIYRSFADIPLDEWV